MEQSGLCSGFRRFHHDLFQHGPLLADDDPLVAGLLTVDGGVHVDDAAVPLRELRDLHRRAVGDLLVQAHEFNAS